MLSWFSPREPTILFHYHAFCMIVSVSDFVIYIFHVLYMQLS